ncbi:MAG: ferrous iron transport protein A [Methanosarcinales archaeon]|jgi:ferrous iron transport protein A|nr:ferrous iron transport protein A [Methanosarcinales archaeon]
MAVTLDSVKPGYSCKVVNIGGNNILKNRLLCMGVTPGAAVEVVKIAPLGDPMELKIRNYNLSIRKKEASSIFVEDIKECRSCSPSVKGDA